VYHSVIWQYVDEGARQRIVAVITDAQQRSHPQAPVFYLRMEGVPRSEGVFEIQLDGEVLGVTSAHGMGVVWLVPS
jgi:hypothetical protein